MVRQVDLRIDVTDAAGLGVAAHVSASVVLPDPQDLPERPMVCFARPAGAYSRGYYTCDLPGPARGAQAGWHAARGWIFVAMDNLGCGDSSAHETDLLDFAELCAAAHAAEQDVLLRLANGVLAEGYPPVNQPTVIGLGQSMGGSLTIWQQARYRGYDGIGVLGFSAVHSHPATPPGESPIVVGWYPRDSGAGQGATVTGIGTGSTKIAAASPFWRRESARPSSFGPRLPATTVRRSPRRTRDAFTARHRRSLRPSR